MIDNILLITMSLGQSAIGSRWTPDSEFCNDSELTESRIPIGGFSDGGNQDLKSPFQLHSSF
jgi:hypothetical protein